MSILQMEMTINSRVLRRELTFGRHWGGEYIYVDFGNKWNPIPHQICGGGSLQGETITYRGNDNEVFKRICKRWYNGYLRNTKNFRG